MWRIHCAGSPGAVIKPALLHDNVGCKNSFLLLFCCDLFFFFFCVSMPGMVDGFLS